MDRAGRERPINGMARGYEDLHLSPDGRLLALTVEEPGIEWKASIWLADTSRGTLTRVMFDDVGCDPVWAPDGKTIAFSLRRTASEWGLSLQRVDGGTPAQHIWGPDSRGAMPLAFSPDGRLLIFQMGSKGMGQDIWMLPLDDRREARPWLQTPANETNGMNARLIITHSAGDEGYEYEQRLMDYARLLDVKINFVSEIIQPQRGCTSDGRKIYALADVYTDAD